MQSVSISQLYFGKDDAESDIARGGLLREGFLRTQAYEAALNGEKTLIIGRKGSGKSAICLMLQNALRAESRSSLVTPDEISAEEIRRFQLPGIASELSKFLIWRYIFDVQIAKFLITYARSIEGAKGIDELATLRKFLIDNGEVDDLSFSEKFWRVIERLKGSVSIEAFSVKVKADVEHPSAGVQTSGKLDFLEGRLSSAASLLGLDSSSDPFHILVDQIERVWSNDRDSDAMVVGLFMAAKHIRQRFDFALCTLFVRTDIYEKLQFQDRDKFRGEEFQIDWAKDSLLQLITARASASSGRDLQLTDLFGNVFPAKVGEESCSGFLVSRTLMRPRDIIQLSNACRDKARTNGHDKITETDIKEALVLYSNWKLSDLQNEWSINFPFLADLFVLFSNSSFVIKRETFEAIFTSIKNDLATRYPTLTSGLTSDRILSNLYSIGFLGVMSEGSSRYYYQVRTERRIEPADREFVIHPCFRNALQSTSALALAPFSATIEEDVGRRRAQFLGEERPYLSVDPVEAPRHLRSLGYLEDGIETLRIIVLKSALPDELRGELSTTFKTMQRELEVASNVGDGSLFQMGTEKVLRHLTMLYRKLAENHWLDGDEELRYTLEDVRRRAERYPWGGDVGFSAR